MKETTPISKRYERQLIMPQVGEEGQRKLQAAKVLVVGAGGLGSPVLYYLAAAGLGTLGFIDSDVVDLTNLQRQILHWEKDLGRPKVTSAQEKLQAFNSELKYYPYELRLDKAKALEIIPQYDLVVMAVDNINTRRLVNEACFELTKSLVEGGVRGFSGVLTTFLPPEGPCFQCLYPELEDKNTGPIGLMGTVPGVIGLLQAQEVIKLVLGLGSPMVGKLLFYDALEARFDTIVIKANPHCSVCGKA